MLLNNKEFIQPDASELLSLQEIDEIINKYGSFLTIVASKPISVVSMFMVIAKSKELQEVLVDMSNLSSYSLVEYMAYKYPLLNKTKKIK